MSRERTSAAVSIETLSKIPLFEEFSDDECNQISLATTVESYTPGQVILRQGRESQNLWFVLEGDCEVVKHLEPDESPIDKDDEFVLTTLQPYANFGEMSFFHTAPHSAGVRAKSAVKLLRLKREDYDELIHNGVPAAYKLAYNAVESLADRLRRMDEWVAKLLREIAKRRQEEWAGFRSKLFDEWHL